MKAKNKIKMFAIIALVALVAVGSTLAYLSSVTETKKNMFTGDKNITANITETNWDESKSYTPGEANAKNPQIVNESKDAAMYTGVKIEFVKKDKQPGGTVIETPITFKEFKEKYGELVGKTPSDPVSVDGINAGWTKLTGNEDTKGIFVQYTKDKGLLAAGATTDPAVFDEVLINIGINKVYNTKYTTNTVFEAKKNDDGTYMKDEQGNYVPDESKPISSTASAPETSVVYTDQDGNKVDDLFELPSFDINVTGYAVQNVDKEGYNPATELLKLAGFAE